MTEKPNTNWLFFAIVLAVVVLCFYPTFSGGCAPNGWQIGSGLFRVTVKPAPVTPAIVPPATRCLIFSATWCKPCTQLKRNVVVMSRNGWRVGPLATDDLEFIDVDGRDERLTKYKHASVPTLVIVDRSGKEIARREGVQTADSLAEWIRSTRTSAAPPAIPVQGETSAAGWRGSTLFAQVGDSLAACATPAVLVRVSRRAF